VCSGTQRQADRLRFQGGKKLTKVNYRSDAPPCKYCGLRTFGALLESPGGVSNKKIATAGEI
jgi:hypothetical protein